MSKRVRKSRRVVEKEVEGVPVEPRPSSVVEGEEAEASDRELPKSGSYGKYSKGEFCELYSAVMG